jgi:ATP-binding protein involved in chromosome partitioning
LSIVTAPRRYPNPSSLRVNLAGIFHPHHFELEKTMTARALAALARVIDPELRAPLTELGMVGEIIETGDSVSVEIKLTIVGCPASGRIQADAERELAAEYPDGVQVRLTVMTQAERDALKAKLANGRPPKHNRFADSDSLTRVLLIGSGKGGVGKSTITANLAVALAARGSKVGLLDADIFGYSIPGQLGIVAGPTRVDELMLPPIAYEVRVISIGMFVADNKPVAWRGPMLHRAVEQFLTDVYWGDLDFLLVDLPPGTGDVAISLGQLLPRARTIVVTTPQAAAANVAERSGAIGLQTGQAVYGVIENMSYLPTANGRLEIFGAGGGVAVAARLSELAGVSVPVLGELPIDAALRVASDEGVPLVISDPDSATSREIFAIADQLRKEPRGLAGKSLGIQPT